MASPAVFLKDDPAACGSLLDRLGMRGCRQTQKEPDAEAESSKGDTHGHLLNSPPRVSVAHRSADWPTSDQSW
jgi:hypothetical protein